MTKAIDKKLQVPQQQAIRDKCFHQTGIFVEFTKEDTKQSIPECFEKIVRRYPKCTALKTNKQSLSYDEEQQLMDKATSLGF